MDLTCMCSYSVCPACLLSMLYILQLLFLFLMVPLETCYLRMYWTDLHQILKIGIHLWPLFSDCLRDNAIATSLGPNQQHWPSPALHWHSEMDSRLAKPMGALITAIF